MSPRSDHENKSRSPICELDLCLVVRNLHTKSEEPGLIISRDIVQKPKCDGQTRQNQYVSPYMGRHNNIYMSPDNIVANQLSPGGSG